MGSDKRSVATDALETLGTIISGGEGRDAIHLAVEPVIAAHTLRPGEDVGFIGDEVGVCDKPLGIVDPFLKSPVHKGQRFWLVVYPRQITSLRHVWSHPSFPDAPLSEGEAAIKKEAEKWISDYAHEIGCTVSALIERADYWILHREYWSEGGRFEGVYLPDEFWRYYTIVTGKEVPEDKQQSFFSCAC